MNDAVLLESLNHKVRDTIFNLYTHTEENLKCYHTHWNEYWPTMSMTRIIEIIFLLTDFSVSY
jgi:hypothetical protein